MIDNNHPFPGKHTKLKRIISTQRQKKQDQLRREFQSAMDLKKQQVIQGENYYEDGYFRT